MQTQIQTNKMSAKDWGLFVVEALAIIGGWVAIIAAIVLWVWGSAQLGSFLRMPGVFIAVAVLLLFALVVSRLARMIRRR